MNQKGELSDYEKFDYVLQRIDATDWPERVKNQARLGAIRAYERTARTGERIKKEEAER